jgi:hypothetical protein
VQQALFLAWKATHYVCAKRLLPSLPNLVGLLEGQGSLQLTEEERRQLFAMSVSTAERFLRTQRKPRLHGLSTTTPGPWCKPQIPVRMFSPWEEDRPGFVEMDLVAHCGEHLDGGFLYTLTLTDLATGWTECLPLLYKSADAVLAALAQARTLFPFPLLGIDTDSGSEFLNSATGWFGRDMCQRRSFRKMRCLKPSVACPNRWSQRRLSICCAPVSLQASPEGRTRA